jgi:hypothetical protein
MATWQPLASAVPLASGYLLSPLTPSARASCWRAAHSPRRWARGRTLLGSTGTVRNQVFIISTLSATTLGAATLTAIRRGPGARGTLNATLLGFLLTGPFFGKVSIRGAATVTLAPVTLTAVGIVGTISVATGTIATLAPGAGRQAGPAREPPGKLAVTLGPLDMAGRGKKCR